MNRFFQDLAADALTVLLTLAVPGLVMSFKRWPEWWRRLRSSHWPAVDGTIESGGVSTYRTRSRLWYRDIEASTVQLAYSYRFKGDYFAGYHMETFSDEQKAWSYVDGVKGKTVQVSYNPRKPEESVLRQSPSGLI